MKDYEQARQEIEEKIAADKEERNRQIRRRSLKSLILSFALVSAISGGVIAKDYFDNHISPGTIVYELNVHNNTGIYEDGEGHKITIDNEQNCSVPNDGQTEFIDRLTNKMEQDGRYTSEDIEFIIEENGILFSADYEEIKEVNDDLHDWTKSVSNKKTR